MNNMFISGFSDEISDSLDEQIKVVKGLGMSHISLRSADEKNIGEYSVEEFKKVILPKLSENGIKVSSIGSPIGKIDIDNDEEYEKQLVALDRICQIANILETKYIRMFSFWMPKDSNYDDYKEPVLTKLKGFIEVAAKYDIVLLHENEKDIFGDNIARCKVLMENLYGDNFQAIFDFANFVQVGENTLKAYEELHEYVTYIHIKDASLDVDQNVLVGTGDGNIPELLGKFFAKGYSGFLTLEPHLAKFNALKDLELDDVDEVISSDELTGEQGYEMQFNELRSILSKLEVEYK